MRKKTRALLLFLVSFFFISTCQAASPVWKITNGDQQLFIGGTIHVLTRSDYPLPPSFETAYRQSAVIVFETDLKKMQTPEFQQMMQKELSYSDHRTLKTELDTPTYRSLEQHFAQRGIPMDNLIKFKPGMIAMTMTIIELQRLGLFGMGVDEFFHSRAINDKKQLAQLETPEEQISFIAGMGRGRENDLINYAIQDTQKIPQMMPVMKNAWLKGDNDTLKDVSIASLATDFPGIYNVMFVQRNNAWLPQIEAMLKTRDVEFILIGAAHLVGNHGILSQLSRRGYTIQEQ